MKGGKRVISQAGEFIPSPAISSPPKLSSKTNKQPGKKNTAQVKRTAKPTQKDRTTATEHEHDTNDMSPTPLHSTTNHPRLGEIPRWYGIREVAVLVSLVSGTILLGLKGWSVRELEGRYLYKRSLNGLTRCHHKREQVG